MTGHKTRLDRAKISLAGQRVRPLPEKNILSLEVYSECICDRMGSMLLFILESLRFEDVNEYEYEI